MSGGDRRTESARRSAYVRGRRFPDTLQVRWRPGIVEIYAFLANDPINGIDPTGEGPVSLWACITAGVADGLITAKTIVDAVREVSRLNHYVEKAQSRLLEPDVCEFERTKLNELILELTAQKTAILSWTALSGALEFGLGIGIMGICAGIPV